MRLADLAPRWVTFQSNGARVGMTFACPHCQQARLGIWFSEPYYTLDFPPSEWQVYMLTHADVKYWNRTGDDFETMTISPSVDASAQGHWHGFIRNGEVS